MKNKVYKLAIESGIGGGTVSIIEAGRILDYRNGRHPSNKADHLIEDISEVLGSNNIDKASISEIIYSESPGSHTALKVGASIAKGLQMALNAGLSSKNLFECISKSYLRTEKGQLLIILPLSVSDFVWRIYRADGAVVGSGQSSLMKDGIENIKLDKTDELKILLPLQMYEHPDRINNKFGFDTKIEMLDLGENLSVYLAYE